METLRIGQRFPDIRARTTQGADVRLLDAVEGHTGILIFYRGLW